MHDLGLLLLRLGFAGTMVVTHGLPKFQRWSEFATTFPDPLHLGSKLSLGMTIFAELICCSLVAAGLGARLAAVPPAITMLVAFGLVHRADVFQKKELALMYGIAYIALALVGPGRLSLDAMIHAKRAAAKYR